jgi:hypothetical protein
MYPMSSVLIDTVLRDMAEERRTARARRRIRREHHA